MLPAIGSFLIISTFFNPFILVTLPLFSKLFLTGYLLRLLSLSFSCNFVDDTGVWYTSSSISFRIRTILLYTFYRIFWGQLEDLCLFCYGLCIWRILIVVLSLTIVFYLCQLLSSKCLIGFTLLCVSLFSEIFSMV